MKTISKVKFSDSGNISIVNVNEIKKYGIDEKVNDEMLFELIELGGKYLVYIDGEYKGEIDLPKDSYYVGDLCYGIRDWKLLLKETDFLDKLKYAYRTDDGIHRIELREVK